MYRHCKINEARVYKDNYDIYTVTESTVLSSTKHVQSQVFILINSSELIIVEIYNCRHGEEEGK